MNNNTGQTSVRTSLEDPAKSNVLTSSASSPECTRIWIWPFWASNCFQGFPQVWQEQVANIIPGIHVIKILSGLFLFWLPRFVQLKRHVTFLKVKWNEQSLIKRDLLVNSVFISRQLTGFKGNVGSSRAEDIQRLNISGWKTGLKNLLVPSQMIYFHKSLQCSDFTCWNDSKIILHHLLIWNHSEGWHGDRWKIVSPSLWKQGTTKLLYSKF